VALWVGRPKSVDWKKSNIRAQVLSGHEVAELPVNEQLFSGSLDVQTNAMAFHA
jgi:hypothetical protein